jgi:hypothetical protein
VLSEIAGGYAFIKFMVIQESMREIKCYSFSSLEEGRSFKVGLDLEGFRVYPAWEIRNRVPLIIDERSSKFCGALDNDSHPNYVQVFETDDNRLADEYIPKFLASTASDSSPAQDEQAAGLPSE